MTTTAPAAIFGALGPAQLSLLRSWKRAGVPVCFIHIVNRPDPRIIADMVDRYLSIIGQTLDQMSTKKLIADELNRWGVKSITAVGYSSTAYLHELKREHGLEAEVCGPQPE